MKRNSKILTNRSKTNFNLPLASTVAAVVISLLVPQVTWANELRVIGVSDYDHISDLTFGNDDATYLATKLLNQDWKVSSHYNEEATQDKFNKAGDDDLLYFTGHGSSNGSLALQKYKKQNKPEGSYANWDTIGTSWFDKDIELAIFAACDVLQRNSWGEVLGGGAHHILGYRGLSSEGQDKAIIATFLKKVTAGNPVKVIDAWRFANVEYNEFDWAITGHKKMRMITFG